MQSLLIYIDPGSGSFLVQAVIAAALGIAFFFKNIVAYIRHFFSVFFHKKDEKP
ncbi:MAG: hypothetical protein M3352_07230 [Bacteroidota bacterium]|nr:hypothetical protein [Bacteroidota bacterium]